ncbi:MAG: hypothetical protein IJY62_00655 [Clostridia bacterium]|nr:hypothetical protein [Clostridia bacterium]
MKLTFLGTGAAEGVPAVFCGCETCREVRRRGESAFRTRAQLLIDGEVCIDFPPDAYYHSLRFGVDLSAIRYLLVTHSHMDHFYAHDFILRGYKYASPIKTKLQIFGNGEVKKVFDECTRREMREAVSSLIEVTVVPPFEPFRFGDYVATALKAQHGNAEEAYVYLIEREGKSYLHLTDSGRLPVETLDWLEAWAKHVKRVDFVTFDCTFLFYTAGEISRHMGLGDNKAMQDEFIRRGIVDGRTQYAITHFSHNGAPLKERLESVEADYGYIASYDGLSLSF